MTQSREENDGGPGHPAPPPGRTPVDLVIVGDVLLDRDITGEVEHISSEAPVPVVDVLRQTTRPGGAGLAALLAARQGEKVTLITALGTDQAAASALEALTRAGVAVVNLGTAAPTTVKTRIRAANQTLVKVDEAAPALAPGPLPPAGRAAIEAADAVLVSDYGGAVAAAEDVREALAHAALRTRMVWDPHPRGSVPVAGVTVVTPNRREARALAPALTSASSPSPVLTAGAEQGADPVAAPAASADGARHPGLAEDVECARRLLRMWDVGQVAITRGAAGAVLVSGANALPLVVPTPFEAFGDPSGAGDRFAVGAAALLARGALPSEAVGHAVVMAAEYVAANTFQARPPIAAPAADESAAALAERVRAGGGVVVATGGCFDLLHRGHVALLQQARRLGDCLIVCVNDDASVTRLKGPTRPVVTAEDRAAVLEGLGCVDRVVVFEGDTPAEVLSRIRPHVFVKGGDYAVGDIPESAAVEKHGGQVVLVPYLDGRSTTSMIARALRTDDAMGQT